VPLDASERLGEVSASQELLPQVARVGGVSGGAVRRRIGAALWRTNVVLHPRSLPLRPPEGLAAVIATITSTNVLALGFAFGPSQPPSTIPAGSTASADFSTASQRLTTLTVPHHPTNAHNDADGH